MPRPGYRFGRGKRHKYRLSGRVDGGIASSVAVHSATRHPLRLASGENPAVSRSGKRRLSELATQPVKRVNPQIGTMTRGLGRLVAAVQKDMEKAAALESTDFIAAGVAGCLLSGKDSYYKKPIPKELADCYARLTALAAFAVNRDLATETCELRRTRARI